MTRRSFPVRAAAVVTASLVLSAAAHAATVNSNNTAPGDAFTNATTTNTGQAVGASGWYYNNVRNAGTVGINTDQPRSGNGSVGFSGTLGPGGNSSKADIEYLPGAIANGAGNYASTQSLGLFSDFSGATYDWYRESGSGATVHLHPSLRILLDLDGNIATTGDRGGLVFERIYNGTTVVDDTWNTDTIGATTKLWNFGLGLGNEFDIDGDGSQYDMLSEWQASGRMANAVIIGFSSGIGSGWGTFSGAVDNIGWTIGGVSTITNFEVDGAAVPEPASLALVGLALAGLAASARRRQR